MILNSNSMNKTGKVCDLGSRPENVMSYTMEISFPNRLELERYKATGLTGKKILSEDVKEEGNGSIKFTVRIRSENGI